MNSNELGTSVQSDACTELQHAAHGKEKNNRINAKKTMLPAIDLFPWVFHFDHANQPNMSSLLENMKCIKSNISSSINDCYEKPVKAALLKESIHQALSWILMSYRNLPKGENCSAYLESMSDLLAMYIDMELRASKRGQEQFSAISTRLICCLYTYLDNSTDYMVDTLIKIRHMSHLFHIILDPIMAKILKNIPSLPKPEIVYVRYLLGFRLWKMINSDLVGKKQIRQTAVSLLGTAPVNLPDFLTNYYGVNCSGSQMRSPQFLMKHKFDVKACCADFINFCKRDVENCSLADDKMNCLERVQDPQHQVHADIIAKDSSSIKKNSSLSEKIIDTKSCASLLEISDSNLSNNLSRVSINDTTSVSNKKSIQSIRPLVRRKLKKSNDIIIIDITDEDSAPKITKKKNRRLIPWLEDVKKQNLQRLNTDKKEGKDELKIKSPAKEILKLFLLVTEDGEQKNIESNLYSSFNSWIPFNKDVPATNFYQFFDEEESENSSSSFTSEEMSIISSPITDLPTESVLNSDRINSSSNSPLETNSDELLTDNAKTENLIKHEVCEKIVSRLETCKTDCQAEADSMICDSNEKLDDTVCQGLSVMVLNEGPRDSELKADEINRDQSSGESAAKSFERIETTNRGLEIEERNLVPLDSFSNALDCSSNVRDYSNFRECSSKVRECSPNVRECSSNMNARSTILESSSNVLDCSSNVLDCSSNVLDCSSNVDRSSNILDCSSNVDRSSNILDCSTNVDRSSNILDCSSNVLDSSSKILESNELHSSSFMHCSSNVLNSSNGLDSSNILDSPNVLVSSNSLGSSSNLGPSNIALDCSSSFIERPTNFTERPTNLTDRSSNFTDRSSNVLESSNYSEPARNFQNLSNHREASNFLNYPSNFKNSLANFPNSPSNFRDSSYVQNSMSNVLDYTLPKLKNVSNNVENSCAGVEKSSYSFQDSQFQENADALSVLASVCAAQKGNSPSKTIKVKDYARWKPIISNSEMDPKALYQFSENPDVINRVVNIYPEDAFDKVALQVEVISTSDGLTENISQSFRETSNVILNGETVVLMQKSPNSNVYVINKAKENKNSDDEAFDEEKAEISQEVSESQMKGLIKTEIDEKILRTNSVDDLKLKTEICTKEKRKNLSRQNVKQEYINCSCGIAGCSILSHDLNNSQIPLHIQGSHSTALPPLYSNFSTNNELCVPYHKHCSTVPLSLPINPPAIHTTTNSACVSHCNCLACTYEVVTHCRQYIHPNSEPHTSYIEGNSYYMPQHTVQTSAVQEHERTKGNPRISNLYDDQLCCKIEPVSKPMEDISMKFKPEVKYQLEINNKLPLKKRLKAIHKPYDLSIKMERSINYPAPMISISDLELQNQSVMTPPEIGATVELTTAKEDSLPIENRHHSNEIIRRDYRKDLIHHHGMEKIRDSKDQRRLVNSQLSNVPHYHDSRYQRDIKTSMTRKESVVVSPLKRLSVTPNPQEQSNKKARRSTSRQTRSSQRKVPVVNYNYGPDDIETTFPSCPKRKRKRTRR